MGSFSSFQYLFINIWNETIELNGSPESRWEKWRVMVQEYQLPWQLRLWHLFMEGVAATIAAAWYTWYTAYRIRIHESMEDFPRIENTVVACISYNGICIHEPRGNFFLILFCLFYWSVDQNYIRRLTERLASLGMKFLSINVQLNRICWITSWR